MSGSYGPSGPLSPTDVSQASCPNPNDEGMLTNVLLVVEALGGCNLSVDRCERGHAQMRLLVSAAQILASLESMGVCFAVSDVCLMKLSLA